VTPHPTILALDFDGVVCEGMREYFESSRRTCERMWPQGPPVTAGFFAPFSDLRPVIETGWEMPILLRALALGMPPARLAREWAAAREDVLASDGAPRGVVLDRLRRMLDDVRRAWIDQDSSDWLTHHALYCPVDDLRRVVAVPARTVIVTTKEGEFARRLLEHWGIGVAEIYGKESGTHKCDNLVQLLQEHSAKHGAVPTLWFVEDRLETLQCVRGCAATRSVLEAVRLFLAAWGYNTEAARDRARADPRIRLLTLTQFTAGPATWIET
jgi:phosphoglycolate phosphatase-like HAD superfamily hydrolase